MLQEQQPVVGVQQPRPHADDTDVRASALPLTSPRWSERVPFVLAYAGFIGLGLVLSQLGVTWTAMRATFGVPIDAISVLLIAQSAGSVVVSASSGRLTARMNIGVLSAWSCGILAVALLGSGATPSWACWWC